MGFIACINVHLYKHKTLLKVILSDIIVMDY